MTEEKSLEGWAPEVSDELTLEEVIERAFEYRGDVTISRTDGTAIVGFVYNRNRQSAEPYVEMLDASANSHLTMRYADIENVVFTGRDTSAGKSFEAWQRRRESARKARAQRAQSSGG
jgi:prophage tail gpP-like protein